jgi:hypothetical protein
MAVIFKYAIKIVCGKSNGKVVAPGEYWTAINVHNPMPEPVKFRKKIVIALPGERAGDVTDFFTAKLGPDEALEIDRSDIFEHIKSDVFVKGFVIIESEVDLDVVAVYTAAGRDGMVETFEIDRVIPRQTMRQLPDLVPVPNEKGLFCKMKDRKLVVTVKNQGAVSAGASTTKVDFGKYGSLTQATPPLAAGASVDLLFAIPSGCFDPDCDFTITVDSNSEVIESNEGNNLATGSCTG